MFVKNGCERKKVNCNTLAFQHYSIFTSTKLQIDVYLAKKLRVCGLKLSRTMFFLIL